MCIPADSVVTVHKGADTKTLKAQRGDSLLDVLRAYGYAVPALCGGCGTCRKCMVRIVGKGAVVSCRYFLAESCAVVVPETTV